MPVEVQRVSRDSSVPATADLVRWAEAALGEAVGELCIRVVDETEGRQLNARFRGRDRATNVLSFPGDTGLPEAPWLGDLVICAPVVSQEAASQCKPLAAHYAHMVVHGVLHLLGYDHQTEEDAAQMEALEVGVLARFGIANPYEIP